MTPREHTVDSRGLPLHVVEWGSGERTVLLHHGFLDNARTWDPVARRLAERWHVLALDARGFGDSGWVGGGGYYYFTDYVLDVDVVLRALGRERFALVGHSMGGMVVSMYAGAFPERPDALVSLEGYGGIEVPFEDVPARVAEWVEAMQRPETFARAVFPDLGAAAARLRRHNARLDEARALELAAHATAPCPDGGGLRWKHDPMHLTRSPMTFQVERAQAFWARVACPSLLVRGAESSFPVLEGREDIPGAERVVLDGAGHSMHHERPEALADVIAEFLERRWR